MSAKDYIYWDEIKRGDPDVAIGKELLSTAEAAEYLGLSVGGIRHHLYVAYDLAPDVRKAGRLFFTQATLDSARESWGKPGPKPKIPPQALD